MGVHHAWGRSYKDLYQRLHTMQGYEQRYQNGFDCQGLWIEVEVEKELGFKSKRDIETFGIDKFVEACKERVRRFADVQTDQSIRLGYWMDWDNSYYTISDENNYTIWAFLKNAGSAAGSTKARTRCPGARAAAPASPSTRSSPRATRRSRTAACTSSSRSNVTPGPLAVKSGTPSEGRSLLVWTTTPWTLAANVAAAVHPELPT